MTRSTRGVETAVCLTLRLPAAVTEVALIFTLVHASYHIDWFTVPCMLHPVLARVSTRPSHKQILDVVGITKKTDARYVGGGPQQKAWQLRWEAAVQNSIWCRGCISKFQPTFKYPCGDHPGSSSLSEHRVGFWDSSTEIGRAQWPCIIILARANRPHLRRLNLHSMLAPNFSLPCLRVHILNVDPVRNL